MTGSSAVARLRSLVAPLSPARRRWQRFLRDLPLSVDELPSPLEEPGTDDFIICGCPRTGTSLLAAALFQPPRVVTVMEPWDGMRLAPGPLFRSLRDEIETTGHLGRGRLDVVGLQEHGTATWSLEGSQRPACPVEAGWHLGVKWPDYWRYLDRLPSTRFVICLRHPYEVIASFKATTGPLKVGLQRETRFNEPLNRDLRAATSDAALRRVLLFDYVHERRLPHLDREEVFVVRYEQWFDDQATLLDRLSRFLGVDVTQPAVKVAARRRQPALDDRDRELIARHCRTASALGYELG